MHHYRITVAPGSRLKSSSLGFDQTQTLSEAKALADRSLGDDHHTPLPKALSATRRGRIGRKSSPCHRLRSLREAAQMRHRDVGRALPLF